MKPEPSKSFSDRTLGERYGWIAAIADDPIELEAFDTRSQNALKRRNIRTWGDLGALDDVSIRDTTNAGIVTVRRINDVLRAYSPAIGGPSSMDAPSHEGVTDRPNEPVLLEFDLRIAVEWACAVTDDSTLGSVLSASGDGAEVPGDVVEAVDALLAVEMSRLLGYEVTPLGALIEELLSQAKDPELLAARECSRVRPTLEILGQERGVTRERARQKVAKDTDRVRALLASDRFRAIRWAGERLSNEFGLVVSADSDAVKAWQTRLGESPFEVLRWLAGYVYDGDEIIQGSNARSELANVLETVVAEKWLVNVEDLRSRLDRSVRVEAAARFMQESGAWRDIGEGWLVRWDGTLCDKAERVLRLTNTALPVAELRSHIGEGSEGTIRNCRADDRFVRIDKSGRIALRDWNLEEYSGIAEEIQQRIKRGGGLASRAAIVHEFTNSFGVTESSIDSYLAGPLFRQSGDRVTLVDAPEDVFEPKHPGRYLGAISTACGWGQQMTVSADHLRGYSFTCNFHIAYANGCRPGDNSRIPIVIDELETGMDGSLIWRLTSPAVDVGRCREALATLGVAEGSMITVVPSPTTIWIMTTVDPGSASQSLDGNDDHVVDDAVVSFFA